MLRRALPTEQLALMWLEDSFEHFSALRRFGICHADAGDVETPLRIPFRVAISDAQSRLGDETHAAPFKIGAQLENLGHGTESSPVALSRHHAFVLVFNFGLARA